MKKYFTYSIFFLYLGLIVFVSCKKDSKVPENPFDDPKLQAPAPTPSGYNPAPTSFEYIYQNVFQKTCANSGCHDGSFEPDFRTISSSYNSIVYAPHTQTPTTGTYNYRVEPGSSVRSQLVYRLIQYPGSGPGTLGQGRMPWNDTNWRYVPANKTNIENIISWIDAGAKDVFGNIPVLGNKNPNTFGFQVCNTGSPSAFARNKYIQISKSNGPVDLWFYVEDDKTAPQSMASSEVKFSTNRYDFTNAVTQTLNHTASGNSYQDITLSNNVTYNFKLTNFNLNTVLADTGYIFVRTYIKDTDHTSPAETPNNGSAYYKDYFVIKITP
jgi:hypothetical protein